MTIYCEHFWIPIWPDLSGPLQVSNEAPKVAPVKCRCGKCGAVRGESK